MIDLMREIIALEKCKAEFAAKERDLKEKILDGASIEVGRYDVQLVPITKYLSNNPDDYKLEIIENPPAKWRQLGPEHDEYIDKQPTRAFVK